MKSAVAIAVCTLLAGSAAWILRDRPAAPKPAEALTATIGKASLAFEPSAGRGGDFIATAGADTLRIRPGLAELATRAGALTLRVDGADTAARPRGLEPLKARANVMLGDDPSQWRTGLRTFGRVRYGDVLPGVDVDFYGNQQGFEYDFRVAPGVDPATIGLTIGGADRVRLTGRGELESRLGRRVVRQRAPVAFQEIGGAREPVEAAFVLDRNRVAFDVGAYDRSRPLIIDPTIEFSTYLGGNNTDIGKDVVIDEEGNAYVAGETRSTDFPIDPEEVPQAEHADDGDAPPGARYDGFVAKYGPDDGGTVELLSTTYLGGDDWDQLNGIDLDSTGAVYVGGRSRSSDYPTANAYQTNANTDNTAPNFGEPYDQRFSDAVITRLTIEADGTSAIDYSTYLGGVGQSSYDSAEGLKVDDQDGVVVAGWKISTTFPNVRSPQATGESYAARFKPWSGSGAPELEWTAFLGAVDSGTATSSDDLNDVNLDPSGNVYVVGLTDNPAFPTVNPVAACAPSYNMFAVKLDTSLVGPGDGPTIAYSTCLGGPEIDGADAVAADSAGNAYVLGSTYGNTFPTAGAMASSPSDDDFNGVLVKLGPTGGRLYSTYLGGTSKLFSGQAMDIEVGADDAATFVLTPFTGDLPGPCSQPGTIGIRPWVAKLNPHTSGTPSYAWTTDLPDIYANSSWMSAQGLGISPDDGSVYVVGSSPAGLPAVDAPQGTPASGLDAFVVRVSGDGAGCAVDQVLEPGGETPTPEPTPTATAQPTVAPTAVPTVQPTVVPTAVPTVQPTPAVSAACVAAAKALTKARKTQKAVTSARKALARLKRKKAARKKIAAQRRKVNKLPSPRKAKAAVKKAQQAVDAAC